MATLVFVAPAGFQGLGFSGVPTQTRPSQQRRSSERSTALPENANRESPQSLQGVAHLIRESQRRSGALTPRIFNTRPEPLRLLLERLWLDVSAAGTRLSRWPPTHAA